MNPGSLSEPLAEAGLGSLRVTMTGDVGGRYLGEGSFTWHVRTQI